MGPPGVQAEDVRLDYASASGLARRWRRRLIVAAGFMLLCGLTYRFGPTAWDAGRRFVIVQAARSHHLDVADGAVAYEEDPAKTSKLIAEGGFENARFRGADTGAVQRADPDAFRRLKGIAQRAGSLPAFDAANNGPAPFLFLGERRTVTGQRWLVALRCELIPDAERGPIVMKFVTFTFERYAPPVMTATGAAITFPDLPHASWPQLREAGVLRTTRDLRLFCGTADPDDASIVYIPYDFNGARHGIVARLQSNGVVEFEDDPNTVGAKQLTARDFGGPRADPSNDDLHAR